MADISDSGSPWAVAYQLMIMIEVAEKDADERVNSPRSYYLRLYRECLEVAAPKAPPPAD